MNNLILLSENKEFAFWAVEIILDQDEFEIFQLSEKGYGLKYYDSTSGVGYFKELGLFEEKPKLLGVYGEIPENIASEILYHPVTNDSAFTDKERLQGIIRSKGIDLQTSKVAIIRTKKS